MKTPILRNGELEKLRQVDSSVFSLAHARHHVAGDRGRGRARGRRRPRLRRGERGARRRHQRPDPLRPRARPRAGADPVAAGGRLGPPPPRARGHAPADRPGARVRRAARGAPLRHADRLRRQRDQPVPDVRVAGRARQDGRVPGVEDVALAETNVVKGIAKGLLKTISKMGISTIQSYNGAQIFEAVGLGKGLIDRAFAGTASRIGGIEIDVLGARDAAEARAGVSGGRDAAAGRRRLRVAPRGRAPHVEPGDDRAPAALRPPRRPADLRGVREARQRGRGRARDPARAAALPGAARGPVAAAGRDPARLGDRPALRHRRDVARLALARGARDARDRDEPHRRQVEHGRGRGGRLPLHARPERRLAPLGDQAGRLGPLRREHQLPRQRRRAADQDGPGRQARRGRPAAGPQGGPLHRLDPLHHARRGPDLAAAAPRHLLDRGPQAADLRPALRQPARADLGQARVRGRRRHGRRGRREGQLRPRADRGPRRRHRRLAAVARSRRPACRGRSASPRRSRRSCSTTCARASGCRPTASSRRAATS